MVNSDPWALFLTTLQLSLKRRKRSRRSRKTQRTERGAEEDRRETTTGVRTLRLNSIILIGRRKKILYILRDEFISS